MGSGGARDQSRNLRASPGRQYEMAYQLPKSGSAEQTTGQGKKGKKNRNQPLSPAAHNESGQNSVGIKHKKNKNKGAENKPSTNVTITTPASSQESDPDVTSLEVTVPKAEHMFIVGPQRSHIREIREATGVKVIVPPYNSPSDKITLKGDKLQLGPALNLLFLRSQEAQMAFHRGASNQSPRFNESLMQGQGHNSAIGKHPDKTPAPPQGRHLSGENVYVVQDALDTERYKVKGKTPTSQGQVQRSDHKNWRQPGYHGSHQHGGGHHKGKGPHVPVYQEMAGHGHHMSHTPQKGHGGNQGQAQGSAGKGQGQRQRKRQQVFAEYLTREELSAGLKTGTLIEGAIRINPKNYEEAYVPHPDGTSDILISSFKHRNRALNGDVVAVQLLEEGEWKFNKDELASYENDLNKSSIGQNSDDEIVIEAEEIVEISVLNQPSHGGQKAATGSTPASQTPKRESSKGEDSKPDCSKGGKFTPKSRFTTLNDVMSGNSPVKKRLSCDQGNVDVKKMLQRTGKVVAIIERKHSRACTGQIRPMQDKHCGRALFAPNDHRMPRIMIPIENCPKDFLGRPDDYARNLFVARVTDWRSDSMMADGCLHKSLGEAGEVEPETEGMLIENGVDYDEFPQQALDCLPQNLPWRIPESEMEEREDFRRQCVFTIDPATARDLDDALSCEDLGNGRYKVGVHIADVSYFVDEETVLDRVAALRSTSVYLVHKVIPMLPRLLCEQLCSLNPDEDRLTFSVQWTITENGEIEDEWFGRSIIRSCVKLAYDHAQGFIEQPERDWGQQELPPLSKGYTVDDIKSRVLNLHKIAVKLRAGRMSSGALRLDQVKLQYSLDRETGLPNGYTVYQQKDSNKLVEEFMLLANMAVAHRINREFPDKALLRRHPPPQEKMLETLRDQCSALGIHIDTSSAGAFQRSLLNYYGEDDFSMARMQVLVALCSKPMQNAKYFCSGSIPDEHMYHHYALNVPLYTHFTSPIRRYPDILVHRLLAASLDYCAESKRSSKEIQKWADHANDKKLAAKRVGDLSSELFFSVFVKTAGPLEEKAMVMGVMDKAFDIFVLRLGVSKRVYCDKLPLKEKIFRREHKVPSLVLVWQAVDGEPEVRQEITIFTVVDCVLATGDLPTTWTAVVKRPEPHNFDAFGLMGGANQQMGGAFEQIKRAHQHNSLEGGLEGGGTGDLADREMGHNDEELSRATEALSLNAEHGK
ncbi:DIS3-like exonuclease 2 isoform X2 [Dreissena polymorpha]|uniref:DIS3-like exonuclease 2 isoform X2 n=1 Tax=Dreissena polymorpha TaxID=45954 RepID=UPI0022646482|nr:DIS3-like exonuclease 2 isoform X2 [Dreissena polymorpha]